MTGPGQELAATADEDRTEQGAGRETIEDLEPEEGQSADVRAGKRNPKYY
jgi:hypothetical protein